MEVGLLWTLQLNWKRNILFVRLQKRLFGILIKTGFSLIVIFLSFVINGRTWCAGRCGRVCSCVRPNSCGKKGTLLTRRERRLLRRLRKWFGCMQNLQRNGWQCRWLWGIRVKRNVLPEHWILWQSKLWCRMGKLFSLELLISWARTLRKLLMYNLPRKRESRNMYGQLHGEFLPVWWERWSCHIPMITVWYYPRN